MRSNGHVVASPRFLELYQEAQRGQWYPDDGSIDWSRRPVVEDFWLYTREARELRAHVFADLLYGEQFTFRAAGARLDALEQSDEKACYALMIVDEHRHADVVGRYVRELDRQRDPDPRLVHVLDWTEGLDVEAFILGSLVLESVTTAALPTLWRGTRDPLLRAFLPKIAADESRHQTFAETYLERQAARWSSQRRRALADVAARLFREQTLLITEPAASVLPTLPRPLQFAIGVLGRQTLSSGTRSLARVLNRVGLEISAEMRRVI